MSPSPTLILVSPFPDLHYLDLWQWMNEFPERNFDDYGPKSIDRLIIEMENRKQNKERTWGVMKDGKLVGCIGYQPITPRLGTFHGIIFTQSAWGRETTMTAVKMVLQELFDSGVEKVMASFFADNKKILRFLIDCGAKVEGLLKAQTMRGGKPCDMVLLGIFRKGLVTG